MTSYDSPRPMSSESCSGSPPGVMAPISPHYFRMNGIRALQDLGGLYLAAYLAFATPPTNSIH